MLVLEEVIDLWALWTDCSLFFFWEGRKINVYRCFFSHYLFIFLYLHLKCLCVWERVSAYVWACAEDPSYFITGQIYNPGSLNNCLKLFLVNAEQLLLISGNRFCHSLWTVRGNAFWIRLIFAYISLHTVHFVFFIFLWTQEINSFSSLLVVANTAAAATTTMEGVGRLRCSTLQQNAR